MNENRGSHGYCIRARDRPGIYLELRMATAAHALTPLAQLSRDVAEWVDAVRELTQPRAVHWCEGTEAEARELTAQLLRGGELTALNPEYFPGCHLYRSSPGDVARVEHLTYICTRAQEDAGPNNHWMDPQQAHAKMRELFRGCMRGRTLYVIPYCMGPIASPLARCGVEITDSAYVVLNMLIMTRAGRAALERIAHDGGFVRGLHSVGELDPERRFIMHFPEELAIESFGSGYGGNALLGKKCHALRIASWQARTEGWLAEHMLIVGLQNPRGETHYLACAFPSACGKTNLAMLIPPVRPAQPGFLAPRRGGRRRADQRARVRRPAPRGRAAGVRGTRLAARRTGRRIARLGDHRRGGRSGGCHQARPDGHAAVLRLQLRRLLAALAQHRRDARATPTHLPRQLVPARRARQVPVARLRREPAGARLDAGALRRQGGDRKST